MNHKHQSSLHSYSDPSAKYKCHETNLQWHTPAHLLQSAVFDTLHTGTHWNTKGPLFLQHKRANSKLISIGHQPPQSLKKVHDYAEDED